MKPITIAQWHRMNNHQRSWVVCRALGEHARVFWHITLQDGTTVGGSYDSAFVCRCLIDHAASMSKKEAKKAGLPFPVPQAAGVAVPSVAFPKYAEIDHVGFRLGMDIFAEWGHLGIARNHDEVEAYSGRVSAIGETTHEAMCLLFLKLRKLIQP